MLRSRHNVSVVEREKQESILGKENNFVHLKNSVLFLVHGVLVVLVEDDVVHRILYFDVDPLFFIESFPKLKNYLICQKNM